MLLRTTLIAALCMSFLFVTGCDDDNTNGPDNTPTGDQNYTTRITWIELDGYLINIWGLEQLYVGYNQLRLEVIDLSTNEVVTPDFWQYLPTMQMENNLMHSAPRTGPDGDKFDLVFIMPSMANRKWNLALTVQVNGVELKQDFRLDVLPANYCKIVGATTGGAQDNYAVALKKSDWKVGLNDIEFVLYDQKSLMQFHPVSVATVEMTPDMPSMGHGSNNNIAPVASETPGLFKGQANFTMSGRWRLTFDVEIPVDQESTIRLEDIEMFIQVP